MNNPLEKVLITGVNGLLAANAIEAFLDKGYLVTGILRGKNRYRGIQHPNLELYDGSFLNMDDLENAIKGCNHVIHIAALTAQGLTKRSDYDRINVEGALKVLDAAKRNRLKRMVFVSTTNVFGYGCKDQPGDETQPIESPFSGSFYAQSKLEAQTQLLKKKGDFELVIVNPTFMLGPYDAKPGSGRIILMGYKKKFVFVPPGGKNFVHVKDVARGLVEALEKGRDGEAYLMANENLTYLEFFKILSKITGQKPALLKIPKGILIFMGFWGSFLRAMGLKTELSLPNMKILCAHGYYSNQKTKDELGLSFQNTEKAIADAIQWFRKEGIIR